MSRSLYPKSAEVFDNGPPSETWLFVQAITGKPIPKIVSPEARARAERAELERLARFSESHARELSRLREKEFAARRYREILEWTAQISDRAAKELRALQLKEAAERAAWQRAEEYARVLLEEGSSWANQPRAPRGQSDGGRWVAAGAGEAGGAAQTVGQSIHTAIFRPSSTRPQISLASAQVAPARPGYFPRSINLPAISANAAKAAGAVAAQGAAAAMNNASMISYWSRVPANQGMILTWWPELEARVRAGTLSQADAEGFSKPRRSALKLKDLYPQEVHERSFGSRHLIFLAKQRQYTLRGKEGRRPHQPQRHCPEHTRIRAAVFFLRSGIRDLTGMRCGRSRKSFSSADCCKESNQRN